MLNIDIIQDIQAVQSVSKVLPKPHWAALMYISVAVSQVPASAARPRIWYAYATRPRIWYASAARPRIWYEWVHHVLCLITLQLLLAFNASMHGGMARLSQPEWLATYWDGWLSHWQLPILVLIRAGVEQLCWQGQHITTKRYWHLHA